MNNKKRQNQSILNGLKENTSTESGLEKYLKALSKFHNLRSNKQRTEIHQRLVGGTMRSSKPSRLKTP